MQACFGYRFLDQSLFNINCYVSRELYCWIVYMTRPNKKNMQELYYSASGPVRTAGLVCVWYHTMDSFLSLLHTTMN
jgi:hypothetical protein